MRLLLLTNNLNEVNGITTFLFQQTKVLIQKYNYEIFIIYSDGDSAEKFEKLGVKLIGKNFFSFEKRSLLNFFLSVIYCFYILIKYKIEVVNPQIHYTAAFSFYPSRILRRVFIQTVHDIIINFNWIRPLYGKNFITINKINTEHIKHSIKNACITLVRCPFELEEKELYKEEQIKIVSSGRLVKEKKFEVYLKAISKLNKNTRNKVKFYVTGKGNYSNELKSLCKELNINVEFMGIVKDINIFYENTHIFVMSTGNLKEGLGLGIIQAALKKNLIITPGYHSIKEILLHEKDGFIFEMGDSKELASILNYVIANYDEVKTLANNFHLKIKDEFSYEKNGQILNKAYSSLL